MKLWTAIALAVLALAVAGGASAEDVAGPHKQVRVGLRSGENLQGYLRGRSADEVVVYTGDQKYRRLEFDDIQRFEVRQRTGSHMKRGALIGAVVWITAMKIAAIDSLEDAGLVSWQSGAILAGSVGAGAVIGSRVPRYGWREVDPRRANRPWPAPGLHFTLRF